MPLGNGVAIRTVFSAKAVTVISAGLPGTGRPVNQACVPAVRAVYRHSGWTRPKLLYQSGSGTDLPSVCFGIGQQVPPKNAAKGLLMARKHRGLAPKKRRKSQGLASPRVSQIPLSQERQRAHDMWLAALLSAEKASDKIEQRALLDRHIGEYGSVLTCSACGAYADSIAAQKERRRLNLPYWTKDRPRRLSRRGS